MHRRITHPLFPWSGKAHIYMSVQIYARAIMLREIVSAGPRYISSMQVQLVKTECEKNEEWRLGQ